MALKQTISASSPPPEMQIVAVFPNALDLRQIKENEAGLGIDLFSPAAAVKLNTKRNYLPELVFKDDGTTLSFITTFTVDPNYRVTIARSVL